MRSTEEVNEEIQNLQKERFQLKDANVKGKTMQLDFKSFPTTLPQEV